MKKAVSILLAVLLFASLTVPAFAEEKTTYTVGICNFVDDASLNQIIANIRARLSELESDKVSFNILEDNCNLDANVMNQIITNFLAQKADLLVGVATPVAMGMQAATEDNKVPVVFAAVSDPLGAGLVDSLRIKGVHIAFQSAQAAAAAMLGELAGSGEAGPKYFELLKSTTGWKEMERVRNVRASFSWGMPYGVMAAGLAWMTCGKFPNFRVPGCDEGDAKAMKPLEKGALEREAANDVEAAPTQPDRLTDVFMSGTVHEEDQPCHLRLRDPAKCAECEATYASP